MRLIDADAFKDFYRDELERIKKCFKTEDGLELLEKYIRAVIKDIDAQPTINGVIVPEVSTNEFESFLKKLREALYRGGGTNGNMADD